ncbi:MAG: rhamnulokinase, partial [Lentisphaeria bacterium]
KNFTNVLAIDLGASSGTAVLGSYDGKKLSFQNIHKFENGGELVSGEYYWDILKLLHEIKVAINKAAKKTDGNLLSLGIDTWGVDYGLLDKSDRLLANPYCYRDSRTDGLMEEICEKIGKENIYRLTGIQFIWFNTLYQLYADKKYRPWLLDNAESLLFIPDLLNFFLTGKKFNEHTMASTSQMLVAGDNTWATSLLDELGLPADILQNIIYPGSIVGQLSPLVKEECRLTEDINVTAVASHDTASAIAAAPLEDSDNSAYLSSGTWSLMGVEIDKPFIAEASLARNFTNEAGLGGKITFLKNLCGLWLIQECRRNWQKEGLDISYDQLDKAAWDAESGRFQIDPNHPDFKNPSDMPAAIRNYCQKTGQPEPQDYGEMARGIYESLAASYGQTIRELEEATGKEITSLNIVGGGTKVDILNQFTADTTGKKVICGPDEATAIGNIIAQLMAAGEIDDLQQGRDLVRETVEIKTYYPQ